MYFDVVEAAALRDYAVYLRFADGTEGTILLDRVVGFGGVFAPLADKDVFCKLRVDPESDTIVWPNGADLAPDVLYKKIKSSTTQPVEY
jgi:Protein of unknown function (DUF2442)